MKLLLTSAGLTNKSIINALLELTQKPFDKLNLLFIPTAANIEVWDKGWMIDNLYQCQKIGFNEVDIIDIAAVSKEIWLPRFEKADILMFWWWNSFYLLNKIEKSWLKEMLPEMLKSKVFVWISAWSMIACESMDLSTSKRLYDEDLNGNETDEWMWFTDVLVRPHLNSPYFPNLNLENLEDSSKEFPETFYAIDDDSAIKVDGDKIEVVSEGVWRKFN